MIHETSSSSSLHVTGQRQWYAVVKHLDPTDGTPCCTREAAGGGIPPAYSWRRDSVDTFCSDARVIDRRQQAGARCL